VSLLTANKSPLASPFPHQTTISEQGTVKSIVIDQKRLKEFDRAMKLASKVINADFRLPRGALLTPAERRELRAEQQRARRASKAIANAIL
jgi:hypothetical protein